jgi:hypothetical protein
MNTIMNLRIDVKQILEELSYRFSSPEAEMFYKLLLNKEYKKAKKMLLEHISDIEAEAIIKYIDDLNTQKINLVEINPKLIEKVEGDKEYIFKFGKEMVKSQIYFINNEFSFYAVREFVSVDKAMQIWEIICK